MREMINGKLDGEILQETEFGVSMALRFRQSLGNVSKCIIFG
jgi:hypothetical protein